MDRATALPGVPMMGIPVITMAVPQPQQTAHVGAVALPGGSIRSGLRDAGVWIYEIEDGEIARQAIVPLGTAKALHTVLANPLLERLLCLGETEAASLRRAIAGAIDTFHLAATLQGRPQTEAETA